MYDTLAFLGSRGNKGVPSQRHFTKAGTKTVFPDIKDSAFSGAIQFYDARVDDARLVIDVVRTAAGYGALAASRTQVVGFTKDASGRVIGAELAGLETGERLNVRAKHIINATGVWTEESESLANPDGGLEVLASKGIHIVVPATVSTQPAVFSPRLRSPFSSSSLGSVTGLSAPPIPPTPRTASVRLQPARTSTTC